jgi:type VI secretion system secreted protein VgrG
MPTFDTELASAANFNILGASTVTNTGLTVVSGGNLGLYPGTSVTGFPPGTFVAPAVEHVTDAVAQQAQADATTAYNYFAGLPSTGSLPAQLAGLTFTPGVYAQASAVNLASGQSVTLDAQGNSAATFVFQIGSALTLVSGSSVILKNGAQPRNIVWQVGSSATIGTTAIMFGDVIALASVTLAHLASLNGRAIGLTGAVSMDTNLMTAPAPLAGAPVVVVTLSGGVSTSGIPANFINTPRTPNPASASSTATPNFPLTITTWSLPGFPSQPQVASAQSYSTLPGQIFPDFVSGQVVEAPGTLPSGQQILALQAGAPAID